MKKQIAVLMAAATAVTTVAPAIANAAVNEHLDVSADTVSAKIKEALGKQYKVTNNEGIGRDDYKKTDDIEDYQKSQYLVVLSVKGAIADQESNGLLKDADAAAYTQFIKDSNVKKVENGHEYIVTDAAKASSLIEKLVINNEEAIVSIVDKGATKDGEAVEITTDKLIKEVVEDSKTEQKIDDVANFLAKFVKDDKNNKAGFVKELKVNDEVWTVGRASYSAADKVKKIEAKLTSGAVVKLEPGDKAIDLHDVMTDKTELKVTDEQDKRLEGIEQSAYDKVTGFKNLTSEDGKRTQIDVPTGDTEVYVLKDIVTKEVKLEDVFTKDGGYTKEGADFVNKLKNAAKKVDNAVKEYGIFNHEGTSYKADKDKLSEALKDAKIVNRDGKFALEFTVAAEDANDATRKINLKIALTGKNATDLQVVKNDLRTPVDVVVGKFTKIIGANRYETAIEVSKERFRDGEADSVVIVGGNSVIDGLSAAPLASSVNAPILLADKNGLSKNTLAEIERACGKLYNKTVYIVGGESSVPASVKKQLMEKYPNVVVERLAGANRFDTSLSVAKKLKNHMRASVFAVGGDGAADAMSIAPVAANKPADKVSPVLVVPKASVSRDVRDFLGQADVKNIVAVGGEASISTQALKDLRAVASAPTVDRISGSNRYDTNLAILKKYYPSNIAIKGLIVASGANDKLVDAQTSSVLASKEGYPIVLADGKLNADQAKYLKDYKKDLNKNVNQVGGVVAADFMKAVVDSLGL